MGIGLPSVFAIESIHTVDDSFFIKRPKLSKASDVSFGRGV